MDYAALAPEINSARMYAGPGNGPMLAAGSAWDTLATELAYAAAGYTAAIAEMTTGKWRGPASAAMAAAATPYASWMGTTATQALQAAAQARAAAGAYESAFALTVPPPVIAANRAQLATLVATNLLGQNTPAIAATETHYAEMWAQDATAMYGYAASSAAASQLMPFAEPPATTSVDAGLTQSAATVDAATQGTLSQLVSTIPSALQGLATPLGAESTADWLGLAGTDPSTPAGVLNFLTGSDGSALGAALSSVGLNTLSSGFYTPGNFLGTLADAVGMAGVGGAVEAGSDAVEAAVGEVGASVESLGSAMTAGAGNAAAVGSLSVPPSWTAATSPLGSALSTLPGAGAAAAPGAEGPSSLLGGLPLSGLSGRSFGETPRYGFRPTVVMHPPAAG